MTKNTETLPVIQEPGDWTLLSLLAAITNRAGQTFSWYTSKKGRVWATLKGFKPVQFSTSVELLPSFSDEQVFDALKVLYTQHFPKVSLERPPLPTWIPARDIPDYLTEARMYVADIWLRWQGGEVFWDDTLPLSGPDAKTTGDSIPDGPAQET